MHSPGVTRGVFIEIHVSTFSSSFLFASSLTLAGFKRPFSLVVWLDNWGCHFPVLSHTSTTASAFNAGWLGKNISHGDSLHICGDRKVPLSWRFRSLSRHCWSHQCHSCCLWIAWGQGPRERGKTPRGLPSPFTAPHIKKRDDFFWGHFCLHLVCSSEFGLALTLGWVVPEESKLGSSLPH